MTKEMTPWGDKEKKAWLAEQSIKRSYLDDVVSKIEILEDRFKVINYGTLRYGESKYPLYILINKNFDDNKKTMLITGGVHGYETSGVHGALAFLDTNASAYNTHFNIISAPCISPWGYETINRWNPNAVDPNRSFYTDGPAEECNLVMKALESISTDIFAHIDLHETTDTDSSVFRPALELRDGIKQDVWDIPDGFYLVGDCENPQAEFQKAIINSVREVTHIAPSDQDGKIIGQAITQAGVINYPVKKLYLCAGLSNASFCSTTEVYPDSPKVNHQTCIKAQIAAICGGLDHLLGD